jgi:hypothetical protein
MRATRTGAENQASRLDPIRLPFLNRAWDKDRVKAP